MKVRRTVVVLGALWLAVPARADAGAASATCLSNGRLMIESIDDAVIRFPELWDFEIRNLTVDGSSVGHSMSVSNKRERYTLDRPIRAGELLSFEFRQVRNGADGGGTFESEWTMHRLEPIACLTVPSPTTTIIPTMPPPTTTEAPPTTDATTTTDNPATTTTTNESTTTVSGTTTSSDPTIPAVPTTVGSLITVSPGRPNQPQNPGEPNDPVVPDRPATPTALPVAGNPSELLYTAAVLLVAVGATVLVVRGNRRESQPTT